jgi:predicted transcriptional regulator
MQKLTVQEEQAMKVIWQSGESHIRAILEQIGEDEMPYTTLASTIKNLEKKGFLKSRKIGNVSLYTPLITEEVYKNSFIHRFVEDYFDSSYQQMVNFFVKNKKLSSTELQEIISMIESGKK